MYLIIAVCDVTGNKSTHVVRVNLEAEVEHICQWKGCTRVHVVTYTMQQ